jgi:hypothetical protein
MPPLNRKCSVEESGRIFQVKFQECGTAVSQDEPYTNDTVFVESLSAALMAAMTVFSGDPQIRVTGTGMRILYEPHDGGDEKWLRVVIRERKLWRER